MISEIVTFKIGGDSSSSEWFIPLDKWKEGSFQPPVEKIQGYDGSYSVIYGGRVERFKKALFDALDYENGVIKNQESINLLIYFFNRGLFHRLNWFEPHACMCFGSDTKAIDDYSYLTELLTKKDTTLYLLINLLVGNHFSNFRQAISELIRNRILNMDLETIKADATLIEVLNLLIKNNFVPQEALFGDIPFDEGFIQPNSWPAFLIDQGYIIPQNVRLTSHYNQLCSAESDLKLVADNTPIPDPEERKERKARKLTHLG